jgi:phenylalanyl-tRNA synthetase beta chain
MKAVSQIVDAYPKPVKTKPIEVTVEQVNNLLGTDFTFDDIIMTLQNVGFRATLSNQVRPDSSDQILSRTRSDLVHVGVLKIEAPWWRTDVKIAEDVIEEVGRLNGFDNIPTIMPKRDFFAVDPYILGDLKSKIRRVLAASGANEVLTYSFVSERLLDFVGQDPKNSYKITNSISPKLQHIRQMITPSLLEKVHPNIKEKFSEFALFEMNQVFDKEYVESHVDPDDNGVPAVENALGLTLVCDENNAFYVAKKYACELFKTLGVDVAYQPVKVTNSWAKPFEKKRAADIRDAKTNKILGIVGEYRAAVRRDFKLPEGVAGFEINVDNLMLVMSRTVNIKKSSDFPEVERDVTFRVVSDLAYADLEKLIREKLSERNLWFELLPVSIWQGKDKKTKNISFKLTFADYGKTLNGEEIAGIIEAITSEVKKKLKGEIV